MCIKNLYFTILYLYKYIYAHVINGLFKFPFAALNMLPKVNWNMFSETLEHFTGHLKKTTVHVHLIAVHCQLEIELSLVTAESSISIYTSGHI